MGTGWTATGEDAGVLSGEDCAAAGAALRGERVKELEGEGAQAPPRERLH